VRFRAPLHSLSSIEITLPDAGEIILNGEKVNPSTFQ
jgi:hypothetical protein